MTQDDLPPHSPGHKDRAEQLKIYEALLRKWQKKINLVSDTTLETLHSRHFEDSSQILPMIPQKAKTLYDLGSGAGFPGLVVAIERPDLEVHLIDSSSKKTSYLKTVIRETGLENAYVHTDRIENIVNANNAPDIITARALAPLKDIFDLTIDWADQNLNLRYVLLKGEHARQEVSDALKTFSFNHFSAPSRTDQSGVILRIENVRRKTHISDETADA